GALRRPPSFPRELLETLTAGPALEGLVAIATARTERCDRAIGRAKCEPFRLEPFSLEEARAFVAARRPDATTAQIEVIYRRSNGNPRVVNNLIEPDRRLA